MADIVKKKKHFFHQKRSESIKDILNTATGNIPVIEIRGRHAILISGCIGITDFCSDFISFKTSEGLFCIKGKDLTMSGFENESVEIHGTIFCIQTESLESDENSVMEN